MFCVSVTGPVSWSVHGGDCSVPVLLVQSVGPSMVEIILCQCYWSSQLVRPWRRLFCASVTGPVSWSVHGGDCSVQVLLVQSVGPSMEEIVLCQCYWSSQLVRPWWRLFCASVTGPVSWSVHGGDCSVPVLLVQSVGPSMEEIVLCKCYWSSQLVRPWWRLFCASVTGPVSWSVHGGDCSVPVLLTSPISWSVHGGDCSVSVLLTSPISWSVHDGDCSVSVLLAQSVGPSMVEIVLCQCYWPSQLVRPWWRLFCASVTHKSNQLVRPWRRLFCASVTHKSNQLVRPWWRLFCVSVTHRSSQLVRPWRRLFCVSVTHRSSQLVRPLRRLFCAGVTGPVSWSVHGGDCSVPVLLTSPISWSVHGGDCSVSVLLTGPVSWSVHGGDCSVSVLLTGPVSWSVH